MNRKEKIIYSLVIGDFIFRIPAETQRVNRPDYLEKLKDLWIFSLVQEMDKIYRAAFEAIETKKINLMDIYCICTNGDFLIKVH